MADSSSAQVRRSVRVRGWRASRVAGAAVGAALALAAGVHQVVIGSRPTNDDFMHIVMARQMIGGDWPVRDFFDFGFELMIWLSALTQSLIGHRLLSEAILSGVSVAVATYLVFRLVRGLTDSTAVAAVSAVLLVVAGVRSYAYPKIIIYAVAATLWWSYVRGPSARKAALLGMWTAAAYYWRPDHGVYVAAGVILAALAAHGLNRIGLLRMTLAGSVTAALVFPFLIFVSVTSGLASYVQAGLMVVDQQHRYLNTHRLPHWPLTRVTDAIRLEPAETYAPVVSLRWTAASSQAERDELMTRYGLEPIAKDGDIVQRVRLSERAVPEIRRLINEPIVEDTAGIERSQATLSHETWPFWERWRFSQGWLRFRIFPGVNEHTAAGEAVAALFYALPLIVLASAYWLHQRLRGTSSSWHVAAFALFGMVSVYGLIRTPYEVRAVDGVVLPAILLGLCVAGLWRATRAGRLRAVPAVAAIVLVILAVKSVAVAGQFGDTAAWLTGDWRSLARMRGAWAEVGARLTSEPPLAFWERTRNPPVTIQLARYVHQCVPPSERVLVLWFAPEIYYYADRLMATRHLTHVAGYTVSTEHGLELAKIKRYDPPIVLADAGLDTATRAVYPGVVGYLRETYDVTASVDDDEQQYLVLVRKNRPVTKSYGERQWPCFG